MNKLNDYFMRFPLYRAWEEGPNANLLNWGIFIALSLALANGIVDTAQRMAQHDMEEVARTAEYEAASARSRAVRDIAVAPVVSEPEETNRIIVKFKEDNLTPGLSVAAERANLEKAEGLNKLLTISGINAEVYEVPEDSTAQEVVDRILTSKRDLVEYAEVDMKVPPALIPNDPLYSSQWHHPKVESPAAWDVAPTNVVTVAILDTGVNVHPDLARSPVQARNFYIGTNDVTDVYGHGTAVAGTAAAVGSNGVGISGISPTTLILPIKISGDDGYGSFSAMAQGITYAADNGARVANISYMVCDVASIRSAAQYMRSKGGVVTVSAGNTGADPGYTTTGDISCVSATDSADNRASWSSYGAYVDVAAPGVSIYTTAATGDYRGASGTSFSSPLTAGIYALMFSVNPNLSPSQADNILFSTADDLGASGWDVYYGYGRVNAAKAAALAAATIGTGGPDTQAPSVPANLQASNLTASQVTLSWNPSTDNVGVASYDVFRNGAKIANVSGTVYTNTGLSGQTMYTYTVAARDAAGNTSEQSTSVAVTTPSAPLAVTSASVSVKTGTTATVNSITNKSATVVVKYGTSATALTLTASGQTTEATTQSVSLAGLKPKTKYFYQVIATSSTGETAVSAVSNFRTASR